VEQVYRESRSLNLLYLAIYSFHMPMFAFISGLLATLKPGISSLRRDVTGLLIPWMVFTALYEGFEVLARGDFSHYTRNLQPYWSLWFLLSLFVWKSVLPVLVRTSAPLTVAVLASLALSCFPGVGYEFGLSRTVVFFPFFVLGYIWRDTFPTRIAAAGQRYGPWPFVGALCGVVTTLWLSEPAPQWLYGSLSFPTLGVTPLHGSIVRLGLYAIAVTAIVATMVLVPMRRTRWTDAGRNTLFVFVWHGFVVKVLGGLNVVERLHEVTGLLILPLLLIAAIAITAVFSSNKVATATERLLFAPVVSLFRSTRERQ
jgi:fucose 4-O-acetylase-like acetyltransferase